MSSSRGTDGRASHELTSNDGFSFTMQSDTTEIYGEDSIEITSVCGSSLADQSLRDRNFFKKTIFGLMNRTDQLNQELGGLRKAVGQRRDKLIGAENKLISYEEIATTLQYAQKSESMMDHFEEIIQETERVQKKGRDLMDRLAVSNEEKRARLQILTPSENIQLKGFVYPSRETVLAELKASGKKENLESSFRSALELYSLRQDEYQKLIKEATDFYKDFHRQLQSKYKELLSKTDKASQL